MSLPASDTICEDRAFEKIFKAHFKALRQFLYYRFGDADEAADSAQDAFGKLWENCHKVTESQAKAFLYTVARHAALNQKAHQQVVWRFAQAHPKADRTQQSPDYLMEVDEFGQQLQQALSQLTEAQRSAFLLHRIEGKKYHEIAEILGISVKAVEKRIQGALIQLKNHIQGFDR